MKKTPTLFRRDPDDMKHVLVGQVTEGCEWVLAGEGTPTRKYDGTCVMFDGQWWARREVKAGKLPPANFRLEQTDASTGKSVGWVPMEESSFARWHAEALENFRQQYGTSGSWLFGTYELVGPKIQGDPDKFGRHWLIPHAQAERFPSTNIDTILEICRGNGWEGVVWHHPDGRMAKLKVRDIKATEETA